MNVITGSGFVSKVTPPSSVVTSASQFTSWHGGLGLSADGWRWTLTGTGVAALQGRSSTATTVAPAQVTACDSSSRLLRRAAVPLIAGPDGTWLFSPDTSGSTGTFAPLCAVVY